LKTCHSRCIAIWKPPDVAPVALGCFWPNTYCTCHMCRNCYFGAFNRNVDAVLEYRDPNCLCGRDTLAIGGHLPAYLAIFQTSVQNSDITIKFGDPRFPKRKLCICWRLYDDFRCFFNCSDQKTIIFLF